MLAFIVQAVSVAVGVHLDFDDVGDVLAERAEGGGQAQAHEVGVQLLTERAEFVFVHVVQLEGRALEHDARQLRVVVAQLERLFDREDTTSSRACTDSRMCAARRALRASYASMTVRASTFAIGSKTA